MNKYSSPTFLFWFFWGAEVRIFALSGLLDFLAQHGQVVVLSRFLRDDLINAVSPDIVWKNIPSELQGTWYPRMSSFVNRVHWKWLTRHRSGFAVHDKAAINHTSFSSRRRIREILSRLAAFRRILFALNSLSEGIGHRRGCKLFNSLRKLLVDICPSVVVSGDFLSSMGGLFIHSANCSGFDTVFYPLNWRDIHKGARISLPFDYMLYWNSEMANIAVRNNPWLGNKREEVIGATQFDSHFRTEWQLSRKDFFEPLGMNPNLPVICYSAVNNNAYKGEAEIVKSILKTLNHIDGGDKLQMLVRMNPAGSDPAYNVLQEKFPERVFLSTPDWWRENPPDQPPWSSNTPRDSRFFSNLIEHACANIGLPSTVMLDFAVRKKPSLCIGFDSPTCGLSQAKDYLEQDFFAKAYKDGVWSVYGNSEHLAHQLVKLAYNGAGNTARMMNYVSETVGVSDGTAHRLLGEALLSRTNM